MLWPLLVKLGWPSTRLAAWPSVKALVDRSLARGAAGGALALMLAADSFLNDYAPGKTAVCELASENGLRAAAVMARMTRR